MQKTEPTGTPQEKDGNAPVELLSAYATMSLVRRYEERLTELRAAREIVGPVHPYIGQEAVAVGVCAALTPEDVLVSHYRGHGHAIARGASLATLTAELMGRATGMCGGKAAALISDPDTGILLSSGLVGAGVPIAAGAAMTARIRGTEAVAVAFLGDGALGSGVVHETLNIASAQRLPLILVCEHNGYQGGTRTEEVFPEVSLIRIAEGHRVAARSVDGNDVVAVRHAADEAVARARAGDGPTFLEARTYLTTFHLMFDRPSPERRPDRELAHWRARDPLEVLADRLLAEGATPAALSELRDRAAATVEEAVAQARSAPWPEPHEVHTHVWPEER